MHIKEKKKSDKNDLHCDPWKISSWLLSYKPLHWKIKNKARNKLVISIVNLHYHINSILSY